MMQLLVAAGVLCAGDQVLIAQRPAGSHMAGAWEFPGGKVAVGETPAQGLVRELREELGIEAHYLRYLTTLRHDYPDRSVTLMVWQVHVWSGEPHGHDGQALRWLRPDELMAAGLLPADRPVVDLLLQPSALLRRPVIQTRAAV